MSHVVGICGDSGSGKTTLSKRIASVLGDCLVLECDRYHKWERGNDNWKTNTHLSLESNHIERMKFDVSELVSRRSIVSHDYDHSTGKFTPPKVIPPKTNLVVCGLHALYCDEVFDVKVYMDTEDSLRTFWKIARDTSKRGYTVDSIKKQIEDRKDDFLQYVAPQKDWADIIVRFRSNVCDKLEMTKGIGTDLTLLVRNRVPKNILYQTYLNKGIGVDLSEQGEYYLLEFPAFNGDYYGCIVLAIQELL